MEEGQHVQDSVSQIEEIKKLRRQVKGLRNEKENVEQNHKASVAALEDENGKLRQELEQLKIQNLKPIGNAVVDQKREEQLTPSRSKTERRPVQETREGAVEEFKNKIKKLEKKIVSLKGKIKQFKYEYQQLVAKGRVCSVDCLVCIIHWIYQTTLGFEPICNRLLEKIIMREANDINNEETSCGQFMTILHKCGIVTEGAYIYEVNSGDNNDRKRQKAKEAWKRLMARPIDEKVCSLGDMWGDGRGHCWAVDLESRNENEMMIHDPQNGGEEWPQEASEDRFVQLVSQSRIQRLMVYTVDVGQMKRIYERNKKIFKKSKTHHVTFINRDASGVTNDL